MVKKTFNVLVVLSILLPYLPVKSVQAVVDSCIANVNPTQVNSGTPSNIAIVVNNNAPQTIVWVKITRPSNNFTLTGALATGWTKSITATDATFTGSLPPNGGKNFILTSVQIASVQAPAADWIVEVSDDPSGTNPTSCTGNLGTEILSNDSAPPSISDISVSSVTQNSATINWVTNEQANSKVNYGTTNSYGSSKTDSSFVTVHSLTLTGLTSNTTYHFEVVSTDGSNNTATSSDNSFVTQSAQSAPPTPNTTTQSAAPSTATTNPKPPEIPNDTVAPVVTITTDLTASFKAAPIISGNARDNNKVYLVEYSTDNGLNWLPVDSVTGLNTSNVDFSFQPPNLPDANYSVIVRAFDQNNNEGKSEPVILVIDKFLPVIGPSVLTYGPQFSYLQGDAIVTVEGVDQKITLSAIGGPTEVTVVATSKDESKSFSLTKNIGSNLWSGVLSFENPGLYTLDAFAKDGANNRAEKELNNVFVQSSSKILSKENKPVNEAVVTIFYFDPESSLWLPWDGASFGQENPQKTNSKGGFGFFLPEGKYYLKVEAPGFKNFTSEIFTQEEAGALPVDIVLEKRFGINIFGREILFPDFSFGAQALHFKEEDVKTIKNPLEGQILNEFTLPTTSQDNLNSIELSGKPTLLSYIATWSPETEEQIKQLSELSKDKNFNVFAVVSLESLEQVKAYKKIGAYRVDFIVDSTGKTLADFKVQNVPTHMFISRNQTVTQIINGVLTNKQLQERLSKL